MIKKALLTGFIASGFLLSAQASTGIYGSIGAGIGGMNTSRSSSDFSTVKLRSGVSYRGALGYLLGESNFNYGLELGYTGYPNNTYSDDSLKVTYSGHTIDLLGVGKYNFSETDTGFFVVGKAGAAYMSQTADVTGNGSSLYKKTRHGVKPELALGAGYNVNKNVAVDLTFNHVFANKANPDSDTVNGATQISSVNTLLASLTYNFS